MKVNEAGIKALKVPFYNCIICIKIGTQDSQDKILSGIYNPHEVNLRQHVCYHVHLILTKCKGVRNTWLALITGNFSLK